MPPRRRRWLCRGLPMSRSGASSPVRRPSSTRTTSATSTRCRSAFEYAPGFPFDLSEGELASAPEAIASIVLRMRKEPARRYASNLRDIDEVRFSNGTGTCAEAYSMMAYADGEPMGELGPIHLDDAQVRGMRGGAFAWRGRGLLVFASGGTQRRVTKLTNTDLIAAWQVKLTFN